MVFNEEMVLANPRIISTSNASSLMEEGCLSFKSDKVHVLGDVEVRCNVCRNRLTPGTKCLGMHDSCGGSYPHSQSTKSMLDGMQIVDLLKPHAEAQVNQDQGARCEWKDSPAVTFWVGCAHLPTRV
jgi:hypothetical protein